MNKEGRYVILPLVIGTWWLVGKESKFWECEWPLVGLHAPVGGHTFKSIWAAEMGIRGLKNNEDTKLGK